MWACKRPRQALPQCAVDEVCFSCVPYEYCCSGRVVCYLVYVRMLPLVFDSTNDVARYTIKSA